MNKHMQQALKHTMVTSFALGAFSLLTMGMVTWVYWCIYERIIHEKELYERSILEEILPKKIYDNNLLTDYVTLEPSFLLATDQTAKGYIARFKGEITAVILPVFAPDGYSSRIELLVGIDTGGEILGVRVIKHGETPGLGDKIMLTVTDWLLGFNGKSLTYPKSKGWSVKKDGGEFDQFTGVTITPRAVVAAVYRALQFFNIQKDILVSETRMRWNE